MYNSFMPVITAFKSQKNNKRVNIYLDNEFGFGIDLENFVILGLKVNQEYTEKQIAEIVKKAEFQKTLDKLLRFATLRPRSEKEVKDYFKRKRIHESIHKELFNRLNRLELVDDEKFAQWWVEQRQSFKPRSKRILNNELRIKGIKKEIIEEVLQNTEIDELSLAKKELEKKEYKWKGIDSQKARQKMAEFLLRKGFNWEVVEKVIKKE